MCPRTLGLVISMKQTSGVPDGQAQSPGEGRRKRGLASAPEDAGRHVPGPVTANLGAGDTVLRQTRRRQEIKMANFMT